MAIINDHGVGIAPSSYPIGTILETSVPPLGGTWLECDGLSHSRTTYPNVGSSANDGFSLTYESTTYPFADTLGGTASVSQWGWDGTQYIAVLRNGYDHPIHTSVDGITWTPRSSPAPLNMNNCWITYNAQSGYYLAIEQRPGGSMSFGGLPSNIIVYMSTDLTTWTALPTITDYTATGFKLGGLDSTADGQVFIANGVTASNVIKHWTGALWEDVTVAAPSGTVAYGMLGSNVLNGHGGWMGTTDVPQFYAPYREIIQILTNGDLFVGANRPVIYSANWGVVDDRYGQAWPIPGMQSTGIAEVSPTLLVATVAPMEYTPVHFAALYRRPDIYDITKYVSTGETQVFVLPEFYNVDSYSGIAGNGAGEFIVSVDFGTNKRIAKFAVDSSKFFVPKLVSSNPGLKYFFKAGH